MPKSRSTKEKNKSHDAPRIPFSTAKKLAKPPQLSLNSGSEEDEMDKDCLAQGVADGAFSKDFAESIKGWRKFLNKITNENFTIMQTLKIMMDLKIMLKGVDDPEQMTLMMLRMTDSYRRTNTNTNKSLKVAPVSPKRHGRNTHFKPINKDKAAELESLLKGLSLTEKPQEADKNTSNRMEM